MSDDIFIKHPAAFQQPYIARAPLAHKNRILEVDRILILEMHENQILEMHKNQILETINNLI